MKTLIVEDDVTSQLLLREYLKRYCEPYLAVNGAEAVAAVREALLMDEPYDLICLDIMMPEMDGQEALRAIRALEEHAGKNPGEGAKVLMTTALHDPKNVMAAFRDQCDGYLVKPIDRGKLIAYLRQFSFIPEA